MTQTVTAFNFAGVTTRLPEAYPVNKVIEALGEQNVIFRDPNKFTVSVRDNTAYFEQRTGSKA